MIRYVSIRIPGDTALHTRASSRTHRYSPSVCRPIFQPSAQRPSSLRHRFGPSSLLSSAHWSYQPAICRTTSFCFQPYGLLPTSHAIPPWSQSFSPTSHNLTLRFGSRRTPHHSVRFPHYPSSWKAPSLSCTTARSTHLSCRHRTQF